MVNYGYIKAGISLLRLNALTVLGFSLALSAGLMLLMLLHTGSGFYDYYHQLRYGAIPNNLAVSDEPLEEKIQNFKREHDNYLTGKLAIIDDAAINLPSGTVRVGDTAVLGLDFEIAKDKHSHVIIKSSKEQGAGEEYRLTELRDTGTGWIMAVDGFDDYFENYNDLYLVLGDAQVPIEIHRQHDRKAELLYSSCSDADAARVNKFNLEIRDMAQGILPSDTIPIAPSESGLDCHEDRELAYFDNHLRDGVSAILDLGIGTARDAHYALASESLYEFLAARALSVVRAGFDGAEKDAYISSQINFPLDVDYGELAASENFLIVNENTFERLVGDLAEDIQYVALIYDSVAQDIALNGVNLYSRSEMVGAADRHARDINTGIYALIASVAALMIFMMFVGLKKFYDAYGKQIYFLKLNGFRWCLFSSAIAVAMLVSFVVSALGHAVAHYALNHLLQSYYFPELPYQTFSLLLAALYLIALLIILSVTEWFMFRQLERS
ncbi:hypothetical protein HH1059_25150 [Halorhodospira halochloris]|uniref:Uncharacterized protein n=2 Tax=Halorhodospira halochloris TaxID=1052 RepID=A0A110B4W8_HALHR|nr:hypothetical protein [Halorhodospira halochloris]MBK1650905.1 hypothetical protein [Halorhodospira halochloris]BAU56592.1 hypothetical protein HH1059_25150 [Halorhodospira halochloris]